MRVAFLIKLCLRHVSFPFLLILVRPSASSDDEPQLLLGLMHSQQKLSINKIISPDCFSNLLIKETKSKMKKVIVQQCEEINFQFIHKWGQMGQNVLKVEKWASKGIIFSFLFHPLSSMADYLGGFVIEEASLMFSSNKYSKLRCKILQKSVDEVLSTSMISNCFESYMPICRNINEISIELWNFNNKVTTLSFNQQDCELKETVVHKKTDTIGRTKYEIDHVRFQYETKECCVYFKVFSENLDRCSESVFKNEDSYHDLARKTYLKIERHALKKIEKMNDIKLRQNRYSIIKTQMVSAEIVAKIMAKEQQDKNRNHHFLNSLQSHKNSQINETHRFSHLCHKMRQDKENDNKSFQWRKKKNYERLLSEKVESVLSQDQPHPNVREVREVVKENGFINFKIKQIKNSKMQKEKKEKEINMRLINGMKKNSLPYRSPDNKFRVEMKKIQSMS